MPEAAQLYFRLKPGGAQIFRIEEDLETLRMNLRLAASVNVKTGVIKPQGKAELSSAEMVEVQNWLERRQGFLEARNAQIAEEAIMALNRAAIWVQSEASDEIISAQAEPLLLAMFDLRQQITKRQAEALHRTKAQPSKKLPE